MKNLILFAIIALCPLGVFGQATPKFSDYSATVEQATAKQVKTTGQTNTDTKLNNSLQNGVNFAGHFIVATWECGSDCRTGAIIDGKTGDVFFPSQFEGSAFGRGELDDNEYELFEYNNDSRLFIIHGIPGGSDSKDGTKYGIWNYEWTGTNLKLIKFEEKSADAVSGKTTEIKVYLVAQGENVKNGKSIGCGSSLVAVSRNIQPTAAPLKAAIEELLSTPEEFSSNGQQLGNYWKGSDLKLKDVSLTNGIATIQITGRLSVAGICDEPRITEQIEATAKQFPTVKTVKVFVNGTPLEEAIR